MPWFALYTKPRNEKKIAKLLEEKGIQVYCPLTETIKQWSDRKKKVSEPLFRSYVFVFLESYDKEQVAVLETPGAVRFLWWQGKPAIVREEEIKNIREFLTKYKGAAFEIKMNEGEEVIITEGALKEQAGTIIRIKGKKAILQLRSLGWNITAELPVQALRSSIG